MPSSLTRRKMFEESWPHTFFPEIVFNNLPGIIVIHNLNLVFFLTEYIFNMVDTVLGAEEVKELAATYSKYSSWLEEFHLQDYIDQATTFFERSVINLLFRYKIIKNEYQESGEQITGVLLHT